MDINRQAPTRAEATTEIAAPPETVWDVLAHIEDWPRWNPDVKAASLDGDVAEGTVFRWKAGPATTVASTLLRLDRPAEIAWSGRVFGIRAVHVWHFEEADAGTRLHTAESWEGLIPSALRGLLSRTLRSALDRSVAALRVEAERRAAAG